MKRILLIPTLLFLSLTASSQSPSLAWAISAGGSIADAGLSVTTDINGNVITTGHFWTTTDFDPGAGSFNLTSNGIEDIFVQKLDANGNFLWAVSMGGPEPDHGHSIAVDAQGNIYTTGIFEDTVDFDPGAGVFNLISRGSEDAFVQKLDPNGNLLWAQQIGGIWDDYGNAITVDDSGYVYITGYFKNTIDFDPGNDSLNIASNGSADIFTQKLDANGNLIWAKTIGASSFDAANAIHVDENGSVLITGFFWFTVDFDPGPAIHNVSTANNTDVFVLKLDHAGNFEWAGAMGGFFGDRGLAITSDNDGNVLTTGYFQLTSDFDPGPNDFDLVSNGSSDIFISKLDSAGNFVWAKAMGESSDDEGHSVTTDQSGNVYTTGYYRNTVDFDPGSGTLNITSNGSADFYIQKLDSNGDLLWVESFGGADYDNGNSLTYIGNGNVITTGNYSSTVDFDPDSGSFNLTSVASTDIFVQKLGQCSSVDYSVTQNANLLTANQSGATYQWITCPAMTPINGATNQSYTAIANGNYAVIINYLGCVDTSLCVNVSTTNLHNTLMPAGIAVFPNPNNGRFNIDLGREYDEIEYQVLDVQGRIIESKSSRDIQKINFNIDSQPGTYILRLQSASWTRTIRIIKV